MFLGEHHYRVDAQGRVPLPVRFRSLFSSKVVLTRGFDACVTVYPPEEWRKEVEHILGLLVNGVTQKEILKEYSSLTKESIKAALEFAQTAVQTKPSSRGR